MNTPRILCFSGFDPSAGAGVLADVKTIEGQGGYALAVISALTVQTEKRFLSIQEAPLWEESLTLLLCEYKISCIKIGLLAHAKQKLRLFEILGQRAPEAKVIWDPVLSASAGFSFHKAQDFLHITGFAKENIILTPNADELLRCLPEENSLERAAQKLSMTCTLCLTGVQRDEGEVRDELWVGGEQRAVFAQEKLSGFAKHGSGCVFSSSLATHLALGRSLEDACRLAQEYTRTFLLSSTTLLGIHSKTRPCS